ncbi:MAG: sigma-70 family RNA polymerase sigma factor [Deltaproteobacteria bacterium]|nr:MAG: sigma-70 family RNA polymerase sigma factor [Deltaproteobacteria bacterium]
MDRLTDEALVRRANAGDRRALEAIYRRHRSFVLALARRFTGNPADAQDVMQEVFGELFGRFPGFRLSSTLRAWLYPVVKNRCISLHRKRRPVVDLSEIRDGPRLKVDPAECSGDFERLLAVLPETHREVVYLRFAHGLKIDEIAQALSISAGTVKSRLHYALKRLRSAHADLEPEE